MKIFKLLLLVFISSLPGVSSETFSHRYFCNQEHFNLDHYTVHEPAARNTRILSIVAPQKPIVQLRSTYLLQWETNTSEFLRITLLGEDSREIFLSRVHSLMKSFNWTVPHSLSLQKKYRIAITSERDSLLSDTTDYWTAIPPVESPYKPLHLPYPQIDTLNSTNKIESAKYPPHELIIKVDSGNSVYGLAYHPTRTSNGQIDYEIYVSIDSTKWGDRLASGTIRSDSGDQIITFDTTAGKYMRLVAFSEVLNKNFTSTAELTLLFARITDEVTNRRSFKTKIQTLAVQIQSELISVELSEGKPSQLTIFAVNGAKLFSAPITPGKNQFSVKALGLARGIYLLKLEGVEGIQTQRIMLK